MNPPIRRGTYALVGFLGCEGWAGWIVGSVVGKRKIARKVVPEISKVAVIETGRKEGGQLTASVAMDVGICKQRVVAYC